MTGPRTAARTSTAIARDYLGPLPESPESPDGGGSSVSGLGLLFAWGVAVSHGLLLFVGIAVLLRVVAYLVLVAVVGERRSMNCCTRSRLVASTAPRPA